tara:strand:- start:429 stop:4298 length:3870 start_codon:yes stop_codon:yes gene_type:complete
MAEWIPTDADVEGITTEKEEPVKEEETTNQEQSVPETEPNVELPVKPEEPQKEKEDPNAIKTQPNIISKGMELALDPNQPNALTDVLKLGKSSGAGVGDFLFDAVGLVPWLKPADEWWDTHGPKSEDPLDTVIREVSAVVIPSLVGGTVITGGLKTMTAARHIPTAMRTLGTIAAQAGVEASVAAITSQSYTDDNAAGALNKMFGWNLPWATLDSDSPELRRKKHIYEAAGLSVGVDFMMSLGRFVKAVQRFNLDQNAIELAQKQNEDLRKIVPADQADPITDAVEGHRAAREQAQLDEGIKRYDPDNPKYDPFINTPARPEQKAVTDLQPDALGAKEDLYRIQNNKGTVDGQMRSAASKDTLDIISNATDGGSRAEELGNFLKSGFSANADVIIDGQKISAAEINASVDYLTDAIFNPDLDLKDFQRIIDQGKVTVLRGRKVLSEENWVEASIAWDEAFEAMFNPDNMKASAMLTQQAGDTISSTAKAMNLLDGVGTNSRQWEIISEKMKFLAGEVKANQFIAQRSLELEKLIKNGDQLMIAEWLKTQASDFDNMLYQTKSKAAEVIDELEAIATQNPQYLKAFQEAYDATNGKVDTLYKLHRWAENKIGFRKKALIDLNPEMPSLIVQGLNAIRYNNILSGLASARAVTGNSVLSVLKPVSVLTGAFATADVKTFKRAMWTYGGVMENFKRGLKVMGDDWRLANSNPEMAIQRGRADFRTANMDEFDALESMADGWREEGKTGKVAMWNWAKALTYWNNSKYVRYGVNAMYAIDGFTKSLMASGSARARAYDALFSQTNGSFDKAKFHDLQRHLYSESFDNTGLLTDEAAKYASSEIALNLDSAIVSDVERLLNRVPAARSLFLFPRTGINGLDLMWTFTPVSNITPIVTKAQKTLTAQTVDEIAEVMMDHGLDNTPEAFKALQSEYIGRQIMGSTVVLAGGAWALEGNLTGSGPENAAERARMIRMGWKPYSIRNPITGEWRSYEGLEPFTQILGLTADMIYHSDRVDSSISEDWFRKLGVSIGFNVTNNTFLGGFEPLVSMLSGDESAWNRFWAQQANTTILPYSGIRSILNNAITPQLKDVERDFWGYLSNMNKFLFNDNERLVDMLDIYTGQPIRYHEAFTAAANSITPFFKQNGGYEPWRQWLLATGWSGLSERRTNTISGTELDPNDRQWINNWVAQHGGLKGQIIEMMNRPDKYWDKQIKKYKKLRGNQNQADYPIKKTQIHKELDRIHREAFKHALSALAVYNERFEHEGRMRKYRDAELGRGKLESAAELMEDIKQFQ